MLFNCAGEDLKEHDWIVRTSSKEPHLSMSECRLLPLLLLKITRMPTGDDGNKCELHVKTGGEPPKPVRLDGSEAAYTGSLQTKPAEPWAHGECPSDVQNAIPQTVPDPVWPKRRAQVRQRKPKQITHTEHMPGNEEVAACPGGRVGEGPVLWVALQGRS